MELNIEKLEVWKKILQAFGPSGCEQPAKKIVLDYYRQYCNDIVYDNLGSSFAVIKAKKISEKKSKVMILSHIDEVGFMVKSINDKGLVEVEPLGGINPQTLLAKRVTLRKDDGTYIKGTFSAIAPHLLSSTEQNQVTPIKNMLVDFGFINKKDAFDNGLNYGQFLVCDGSTELLSNKRLLSKAIDNRMGVILTLEILEWACKQEFDFDLYIGFSTQEEVGCRGAKTAAQLIKPDLAIVTDVSPGQDYISNQNMGQLGEGVMLRGMDRGYLPPLQLIEFQKQVIKKHDIKSQFYISPGATDASVVHLVDDGILTIQACLIARNLHSNSGIIDLDDFYETIKMVKALLNSLSVNKIKELKEQ